LHVVYLRTLARLTKKENGKIFNILKSNHPPNIERRGAVLSWSNLENQDLKREEENVKLNGLLEQYYIFI